MRVLFVADLASRAGAVALSARSPREVTRDSRDAFLASLEVSVPLEVSAPERGRHGALSFAPRGLRDLHPDRLVCALPPLAGLLSRYEALKGAKNLVACIPAFRRALEHALETPEPRRALAADIAASAASPGAAPTPALQALVARTRYQPTDDGYAPLVLGLRLLVAAKLRDGGSGARTSDVVVELDRLARGLSVQLGELMSQQAFRALELTWRGLDRLLGASEHLAVRALACTRSELLEDLRTPAAEGLVAQLLPSGERAPYDAALLGYELDGELDAAALEACGRLAGRVSTPLLVGVSGDAARHMAQAPFLVALTRPSEVRARHGEHDVRAFPFDETAPPPAAAWASGVERLARCPSSGAPYGALEGARRLAEALREQAAGEP